MNRFSIRKVLAACELYLDTANTMTHRAQVAQVVILMNYAQALANDSNISMNLTMDEFANIAAEYVKLTEVI